MTTQKGKKELTKRENEILTFINFVISKRGFAPSIREIGQEVGLSSTSTVHNYLKKLEKKGFIKRNRFQSRTIEVTRNKNVLYIPVIEEEFLEKIKSIKNASTKTIAISSEFVDSPDSFLLKIKTNALKRAGVFPGDYLIVKNQNHANNGELIVCEVKDEILLRRYYKGSAYITLEAENNLLKPIFTKEIKIFGRIQGLIRKIEKS